MKGDAFGIEQRPSHRYGNLDVIGSIALSMEVGITQPDTPPVVRSVAVTELSFPFHFFLSSVTYNELPGAESLKLVRE